jgi:large subunit ribosomal protein L10
MATNKTKKAKFMEDVRLIIKDSKNLVLTEYRGMTVEQVTELRSSLRKSGVKLKVLKNTLTRKLFKESGIDQLDPHLHGPVAISFLGKDVAAATKAILNFAKKNEKFILKAGFIEGKVISLDGLKAISSLPSREVMLSRLLSTMQAPIRAMMTVMNGNTQKLVYALNAIKAQKEKNAA